jgi:hypothetical protein
MDWLTAILNSPWFDRTLATVLVFVLLRFLREDIRNLTSSIVAMTVKLDTVVAMLNSVTTHNQTRMDEIRQFMRELIAMWARDK